MITIPEFIFLNVVIQIYILFLISSLRITYETFVIHMFVIYFIICCFILGFRIGWNIVKKYKNK